MPYCSCLTVSEILQERLHHSEHEISHAESDYYVECLGQEEHSERFPVLFPENLPEACFQADADESYAEQGVLESFRDFSYFLGELGLSSDTATYTWESPFNFAYQARFYLPKGLPGVFDDNFSHELVEATWPLLQKTQGRAFFLCTSFRSMEAIANELRLRMGANFTLCVQGEAPKSELLERFKSSPNAVLVGSMSFWEGVDMKGDALQLVVIDKMPFAQFDTPVARAKKDWITQQGKNPFMNYQLPEMITTLRQGVGRLIRSENDFGVIVFGDNRLLQKRYGRVVLESLPAMIRTQEFARVYSFLDNPDEAY